MTTKPMTERDSGQTLQLSFNDANDTLGVDGFIVGKIGRKITRTAFSSTIDDFSFYEGSTLLYTIRVTYSDSAHTNIDEVERTA